MASLTAPRTKRFYAAALASIHRSYSILVEEVEPVLGALEFAGAIAMIRSGLGPETVHWTTIG